MVPVIFKLFPKIACRSGCRCIRDSCEPRKPGFPAELPCALIMKTFFHSFSLLFAATFPAVYAASGATSSLTPIADAYTAAGPSGNLSNNNYGGGGALGLAAPGLPNGEFQSVLKFDLAAARTSFDTTFGAGNWSIDSVSLTLASSPHNNNIYNEIAPGSFAVSLMQNNAWTEGSGNASNPGASGITFNTLKNTFVNAGADQALGTFTFSGGSSGLNTYTLQTSPALLSDILSGSQLSLRLFAADTSVSYLFSSRAATPVENQPHLVIAAVPEPGSIALGMCGLAVLYFRRRAR